MVFSVYLAFYLEEQWGQIVQNLIICSGAHYQHGQLQQGGSGTMNAEKCAMQKVAVLTIAEFRGVVVNKVVPINQALNNILKATVQANREKLNPI